ncbi:MAG TPA: hypothetical protein VEH81_05360 [Ktedonobacteraceae bacterium]|nr:hypothetical protein [Ktedonobacteraceae bacterium]
MEEDETKGHENQPEPEIQPASEGERSQAAASSPGLPPSTSDERRRQFLIGLGIGFIPLVLFFIGFVPNAFALIFIALLLWLVMLIVSIVFLFIPSVRYIGYGLLTSFLISLVVGSIGCIIIIYRPHTS